MPCCAFAACIIGQLLFVLRAFKRSLLGGAQATELRNEAVEWRLGFDDRPLVVARPTWLSSRRAIGGLAFAATVELLLVLGAVYGVVEHFGHGSEGHAAHAHSANGAQHDVQEVEP